MSTWKKKNYSVSSLRVNRNWCFPLSSENNLKKKDRGATEEGIDINKDIAVRAWYDNKRAVTMSNYFGQNPVSECDSCDRSQKKKSNYHVLQMSKFTKNLWVEWIKQTCLFLLSIHGQYIGKLVKMVHCFTTSSAFLDVSLVPQVTAMTKIKNHPKNEDQESVPIRFQMTSAIMRKTTGYFKLMVQLRDLNILEALEETDSFARNAKLFAVLLAVNTFWKVKFQVF